MFSYEWDDDTRDYYNMALREETAALQAFNPVARRFAYAVFNSLSKGRNRRRNAVKTVELVTDKITGSVRQLKNMPLDSLATEVYGRGDRDGVKYGGYYHALHEKLLEDIRGLR